MKRIPAQQGSILVELLVVLVIISVVMVGMVTSFGNISRGQVRADKRLEATQYAIEGIEVVYNITRNDTVGDPSQGWDAVKSLTGKPYLHVGDGSSWTGVLVDSVSEQVIDNQFKRELWIIEEGSSELIKVTSQVCWDVCDPDTQTVSFETYFAKLE